MGGKPGMMLANQAWEEAWAVACADKACAAVLFLRAESGENHASATKALPSLLKGTDSDALRG